MDVHVSCMDSRDDIWGTGYASTAVTVAFRVHWPLSTVEAVFAHFSRYVTKSVSGAGIVFHGRLHH